MRRLVSRLFLTAIAWAALPTRIATPEPNRPDTSEVAEASRHFQAGVRLSEAGSFAAAAAEFEAAYQAQPHPRVLYNLGITYLRLDRRRDAVAALDAYLVQGGDAVPSERRKMIEALIDQEAPYLGRVTIDASPDGSEVWVDGRKVGRAPLPGPVWTLPGSHAFELRAGKNTERQTLSIAAGARTHLIVRLQALPPLTLPIPPIVRFPPTTIRAPVDTVLQSPARKSIVLPVVAVGGAVLLVSAGVLSLWNGSRFSVWKDADHRLSTDQTLQSDPAEWERNRQQNNDRLSSIRRVDTVALLMAASGLATEVISLVIWRMRDRGLGGRTGVTLLRTPAESE
jgi:hypothetical protein